VHQRETGKKRGRLTEQEEDEKILDEELREDEESRATRWITNSPSCKCPFAAAARTISRE